MVWMLFSRNKIDRDVPQLAGLCRCEARSNEMPDWLEAASHVQEGDPLPAAVERSRRTDGPVTVPPTHIDATGSSVGHT